MSINGTFRGPALKALDDEPTENVVRTIKEMVEHGDLDPVKFNMVLEQVRATNCRALAVVDNKAEGLVANPEILAVERDNQHLELLEDRFLKNMHRHEDVDWDLVVKRHKAAGKKQRHALLRMERTGGEPDVYRYYFNRDRVMFFDFSPESPRGRRNLSYKTAIEMASDMGVRIATTDIYMGAFGLNPMDRNSENWIKTSFWDFDRAAFAITDPCHRERREICHDTRKSFSPHRGFRSYLVF